MAKTACEEAAIIIEAQAGAAYGKFKMILLGRAKRLRAEGRKIAQYERIALQSLAEPMHAMEALQREAKRIQKARTKK